MNFQKPLNFLTHPSLSLHLFTVLFTCSLSPETQEARKIASPQRRGEKPLENHSAKPVMFTFFKSLVDVTVLGLFPYFSFIFPCFPPTTFHRRIPHNKIPSLPLHPCTFR